MRTLTNAAGAPLPSAVVRVLTPGSEDLVTDVLYAAETGSGTLSNPLQADVTGVLDFYINEAQTVRLGITPLGGNEFFVEDLDVVSVGALVQSLVLFSPNGNPFVLVVDNSGTLRVDPYVGA